MMKRIFLLPLLAVSMIACNENRIYESHIDPSGNLEWKKDQLVEFEVEIVDNTLHYNEIVALRYAQGYMYTNLPVEIKRIGPDGKEEVFQHNFNVRNTDGKRNGEPAGDIWDLEEMLHENMQFPQKGTYHYSIRHLHERDLLHFVMEVGIIIDKVPIQE